VVGVGIKGIVDRHAQASAPHAIGADDRVTTAVGKDKLVARDHPTQVMGRVGRDALEGRGRVDIPISDDRAGSSRVRHSDFQLGIKYPDAACLDDQIRVSRRVLKRPLPSF
jgi:hypothetical protein